MDKNTIIEQIEQRIKWCQEERKKLEDQEATLSGPSEFNFAYQRGEQAQLYQEERYLYDLVYQIKFPNAQE